MKRICTTHLFYLLLLFSKKHFLLLSFGNVRTPQDLRKWVLRQTFNDSYIEETQNFKKVKRTTRNTAHTYISARSRSTRMTWHTVNRNDRQAWWKKCNKQLGFCMWPSKIRQRQVSILNLHLATYRPPIATFRLVLQYFLLFSFLLSV
jgi:hypothetical protein